MSFSVKRRIFSRFFFCVSGFRFDSVKNDFKMSVWGKDEFNIFLKNFFHVSGFRFEDLQRDGLNEPVVIMRSDHMEIFKKNTAELEDVALIDLLELGEFFKVFLF